MIKEVSLTKGLVATVDEEDWDLVSSYLWRAHDARTTYYAVTSGDSSDLVSMHNMLLGNSSVSVVDHKDGNGLNNRRGNLRSCTRKQNAANRRLATNNKSGYKGVHWSKTRHKWVAQIGVDKKCINLGAFIDPWEAAQAYNTAALIEWGEFALLNTPSGLSAPTPKSHTIQRPSTPTILVVGSEVTTTEIAAYIGANGSRSANAWLRRHGLISVGRQPGHKGENLYAADDVITAKSHMPGQGVGGGWAKHARRDGVIKN